MIPHDKETIVRAIRICMTLASLKVKKPWYMKALLVLDWAITFLFVGLIGYGLYKLLEYLWLTGISY
jgi:hypothetical protein